MTGSPGGIALLIALLWKEGVFARAKLQHIIFTLGGRLQVCLVDRQRFQTAVAQVELRKDVSQPGLHDVHRAKRIRR